MRVLEQKPILTHNMGKKKHRLRKHSKENANFPTDSSDESHQGASGPRCTHINKSINITSMKKALKQLGSLGQCTSCSREVTTSRKGKDSAEGAGLVNGGSQEDLVTEPSEPSLWVCLQCGHLGCDRNSKEKHSLKHYQAPRSASHVVVANTSTWAVWCYSCDDECPTESSRKLQECVDLLKRLASGEISRQPAAACRKSSIGRLDIPVTVAEVAGEVSVSEKEEKSKAHNRNRSIAVNPFSGITLPKVYGLSNLGNTCFFNAVMQNLSHTYILRDLLNEYGDRGLNVCLTGSEHTQSESDSTGGSEWTDEDVDEKSVMDPLNLTLPECGSLTKSMVGFLGEMKLSHDTLRSASNNIINPDRLFGQICKKTPRFKGFQQQDSHELLRHLLEGMKGEEIKRSQGAILKAFNLENGNHKRIDDDTRTKIKEYGRQAKHTFVDSVFGGYFISTVLCEECHMPSQVFEPFQDISLPILEEKPMRPNNLGAGRKKYDVKDTCGKPPELTRVSSGERASTTNQLSKHEMRKTKKQLKKDHKKKLKKETKHTTNKSEEEKVTEELSDGKKIAGVVRTNSNSDECKEADRPLKEFSGSNEDWDSKSDADVEDNIESDASRKRAMTAESQDAEDPCSQCINNCMQRDILSVPLITVDGCADVVMDSSTDNIDRTMGTTSPTRCCVDAVGSLEDGVRELSLRDGCGGNGDGAATSTGQLGECEKPLNTPNGGGDLNEQRKGSVSSDVPKSAVRTKPPMNKREQQRELKIRAMQTLAPRNQPTAHECSIMSCLNQFTAGELLTGSNKFGCERCTRRKHRKYGGEGKRETVYTNASKQLQIFIPPAVLTLHLKRFQQIGFSLRKVNRHVDFPLELDLAPYCSALSLGVRANQVSIRYSLYGVVEHSGRLSGGHYTAYVKVRSSNSQLSKSFLQFNDIHGLNLHKVLEMMKNRSTNVNDTNQKDEDVPNPTDGKWYYMSDTRVTETSESNVLRCQAYLLFYERIY